MSPFFQVTELLQLSTLLLAQVPPELPDQTAFDKVLAHPEFMFFGFLTLVVLVPVLARMWFSTRVKEWEASLKHTMLERGMSAEEIKMVLDAGSGRDGFRKKCDFRPSQGPASRFTETVDYSSPQPV